MHPYFEKMLRKKRHFIEGMQLTLKGLIHIKQGHTKSIGIIHDVIRMNITRKTTLN